MRQNVVASIALLLVFCGMAIAQQPDVKEPAKANVRPTPDPNVKSEPFDKADLKTMAAQCVTFDTEAGEIVVELFPEHAPETVRSFLNIVAQGYLDTTTFSRVVPDFVIQGGDLWTRDGGVNFEIATRGRKTVPDEPNKVLHERGILSMARGEEANTATTNFFILISDAPHLDGTFAAFGRVIKGMDVVDGINKAKVADEKPDKPVRIKRAFAAVCER